MIPIYIPARGSHKNRTALNYYLCAIGPFWDHLRNVWRLERLTGQTFFPPIKSLTKEKPKEFKIHFDRSRFECFKDPVDLWLDIVKGPWGQMAELFEREGTDELWPKKNPYLPDKND